MQFQFVILIKQLNYSQKKYLKIIFFLFVNSQTVFGQLQSTTDSLLNLLKTRERDSEKIELLINLAKEYQNSSPTKSFHFAQSAYKIADSIKISNDHLLESTNSEIQNLLLKYMADALYVMGAIHENKDEYEQALVDYYRSLKIRQQVNDKKGISHALNGIGLIYQKKGLYESSIKMLSKSLEIKKSLGDKKGMANSYGNIGTSYQRQGDFVNALKMHFLSLKIRKEISNTQGIAYSYSNIASIYNEQNNYEDALKMNLQALALLEKIDDTRGTINVYNDIGLQYKNLNLYNKAFEYYAKALKKAEKFDNKFTLGGIYINIGNVYSKQKMHEKAIAYFLKGLQNMRAVDNKNGIVIALINLGDSYTLQGKNNLSLKAYDEAIKYSKIIGAKNLIKSCYLGYIETYSKLNNYQKASEYQKLYSQLNDSILNEENLKQINELKIRYESEKKDQEIELLNREKKLQEITLNAKINKQTLIRKVLIAAFLMVIIIIVVFIISYRLRAKSNSLIALKNEEINEQKAKMNGQEEERKRIAKDLHDGIGGTLAGIKLNLTRISSSSKNVEELEVAILNLENACNEIRAISHNLMPPQLENNAFINSINILIQQFVVPEKLDIHFEYFPINTLNNIPKELQVTFYRILQELLNNIVKFANASKIDIAFSLENNSVFLLVEDNGNGFDTTKEKNGLGLKSIVSRTQLHNGQIIIDSQLGRGTAVNIQIPISEEFILNN